MGVEDRQSSPKPVAVMNKLVMLLTMDGNKTPWPESESEFYRPSDRHLSVKLVSTFADRGCPLVSVTDPHCRILDFLDEAATFSSK
jgi:hypothetical protein